MKRDGKGKRKKKCSKVSDILSNCSRSPINWLISLLPLGQCSSLGSGCSTLTLDEVSSPLSKLVPPFQCKAICNFEQKRIFKPAQHQDYQQKPIGATFPRWNDPALPSEQPGNSVLKQRRKEDNSQWPIMIYSQAGSRARQSRGLASVTPEQ